ncbi:phage terminase large subunit [Staphylococcus felis]|uniref:phage terminase large subunit n=1 Tax=Staphylococcus felis TaxID=46127 RepID=UPI000CD06566|nr:phage terminase large subunit [Staphylococcus felis]AVP37431.1 hypothetical protein C7J90_10860 [Staphylococcus felis]PNZ37109.1 hypothetical protein CD143_02595 [Staphylococcus felis]QQB02622.1 phage terminase large subunit [Staphylococcus felis]
MSNVQNVALNDQGFLKTREERLKLVEVLTEELTLLMQLVEKGTATTRQVERFFIVDEQLKQLHRINDCEYDVARFSVEYFSDDGNPENDENLIPNGSNYDNMSQFHKELTGMLSKVASGEKKDNIAWACPRRHAKTAYGSNIFPVHQAVYKHRQFMVIVSETADMAGTFITWGNRQFKFNEKLINDFGRLLHESPSKNELDNKQEYVTLNGVKIMARGAGGQMRGMRYGKSRPELMVFDDLEGAENVSTPEQMRKTQSWFNEAALPALAKNGSAIYLGTVLCYDSLLDKTLRKDKRFESRRYRAVESFPDNTELWSKWREIYLADEPDATQKAEAFYEDNKAEMDKGVKLLWAEYYDYYWFVIQMTNMGAKSFNQEYQNEPTDEERQIFKVDQFAYYDESELNGKNLEYYCGIDFAMGKEKGDFSSIITLARNTESDVCYVVDVYNERVHPKDFIKAIVERVKYYQYENIAVETQMAQEFFADTLSDKLIDIGYPAHLRLVSVKQRTRKSLRIEAMSPDVNNGRVRFKKDQTDLIDQYEMYPMSPNDDMIDACEMAYNIATKRLSGEVSVIGNYYYGSGLDETRTLKYAKYGRMLQRAR